MKIKLILVSIVLFLTNKVTSQTFDCYITNDTLVSKTQFEFDLYIQSNDESFLLRSVQLSFSINNDFVPEGELPVMSYINGSSKIKKFQNGRFETMDAKSIIFFVMTSSPSINCTESTIINKKSVRIGRFQIESKSGNFTSSNPEIKLLGPKDKFEPGKPKLKMNISKWKTIDCSLPTVQAIGNSGKYFTK